MSLRGAENDGFSFWSILFMKSTRYFSRSLISMILLKSAS